MRVSPIATTSAVARHRDCGTPAGLDLGSARAAVGTTRANRTLGIAAACFGRRPIGARWTLPSRPSRLDHDRSDPALNPAPSQYSAADTPLACHDNTRSNHFSSSVMHTSLALAANHVTTGLVQRIVRRDKPAERRE
jgi:hypothetical protein